MVGVGAGDAQGALFGDDAVGGEPLPQELDEHLLRGLVEGTPGQVKRALRPRTVGDKVVGPDSEVVKEARDALELLRATRKAVDSLALNDIVKKTRTLVEQVIEKGSKSLIDRLRDAPGEEREALAEVVEAAIEFARIVFDDDYAALLRRGPGAVDRDARRLGAAPAGRAGYRSISA